MVPMETGRGIREEMGPGPFLDCEPSSSGLSVPRWSDFSARFNDRAGTMTETADVFLFAARSPRRT